MDGPLAPIRFPHIGGVTMHPTAACVPPPTFVLIDPTAAPNDTFVVRYDHAAAAALPICSAWW